MALILHTTLYSRINYITYSNGHVIHQLLQHFNVLVFTHVDVSLGHLLREAIISMPAWGNTNLVELPTIFVRPGLYIN